MGSVVANYFGNDAVHLHRLAAVWTGCVSGEGRRKQRTDTKQQMKTPARRPCGKTGDWVHEDPPKHTLGKIPMSARADAWYLIFRQPGRLDAHRDPWLCVPSSLKVCPYREEIFLC